MGRVTKNTGITGLTSEEALGLLQEMGVGKRKDEIDPTIVEPLSDRQWLNWVGSGKVCVEGGVFNETHIREVGKKYIESNGRAYSIYSYDHDSGKVTEFINQIGDSSDVVIMAVSENHP